MFKVKSEQPLSGRLPVTEQVQRPWSLALQHHAAMIPSWRNSERNLTLDQLRAALLAAKEVVVLGAAITESEVESMDMDGRLIIAADGSVGALSDRSKLACVVSDFDGGVHLNGAAEQGTVMIVHAHGDNPVRWVECLNTWSQCPTPPRLILTHQTPGSAGKRAQLWRFY